MGRIVYVPENDKVWTDFYNSQIQQYGHGFQGIPYQRGHGLGSFFGRLFRAILPVAKRVGKSALKTVGKEALNMGGNVVDDLIQGRDIKESMKDHGLHSTKNLINKASSALKNQSGKGIGKRPVGPSKTVVPNKRRCVRRKRKKKVVDYLS